MLESKLLHDNAKHTIPSTKNTADTFTFLLSFNPKTKKNKAADSFARLS